jgi:16S rRNA (guanine(966)-N(2))-methyltransferase RsmD
MVRVIAGSAGGLKLKTIDDMRTRPTLDRVKEPMFSMLAPFLAGKAVLDLFAGSGGLGIEALSRGAASCLFNDADRRCAELIRQNLEHTHLAANAEVTAEKYDRLLERLAGAHRRFGLILLDPPYGANYYENVILCVTRYGLFDPDCVIMCEHSRGNELPDEIGAFSAVKRRGYGTVGLTMYTVRGERQDGEQRDGERQNGRVEA